MKINKTIKSVYQKSLIPIRHQYEELGVDDYYKNNGAFYQNPHEAQIKRTLDICLQNWQFDLTKVLDLCAGSGEITVHINSKCGEIEGLDPYTQEAYFKRVGKKALFFNFSQIAQGALLDKKYSLIVCSFALHLASPSQLSLVCLNLSQISKQLLILTPHKKPELGEKDGWIISNEMVNEKVRARFYQSKNFI